jgi:hypothetical protein
MSAVTRVPARALLAVVWIALSVGMVASSARAETYQDKRLGISLQVPEKFSSIPLQPGEYYYLAKFKGPEEMEYGRSQKVLYPTELFVLRVPKAKTEKITITINGKEQEIEIPDEYRAKSVKEFIQKYFNAPQIKSEKDVDIGKLKAKQFDFTTMGHIGDVGMRFLATVFSTDEVEYAVVGGVLASKFDKYVGTFKSAAKTFKLDAEKVEAAIKSEKDARKAGGVAGYDATASLETNRKKKAEWAKQSIAALKGWYCLESEHYVYLSNTDKDLVNEVKLRLETLRRDVYEKLFPPEKVITAVSIVRVCKDENEYWAYGGPGGSAGYWNRATEELVMYDDSKRNREYTFSVMNHEGFHQYIHYACGDLAPHSWYNEGTGDFFAGFKFKNGKFVPGKFDWRTETIRTAVREGRAAPLKKLFYFEQKDYYANAEVFYAEGWALIYFLREHAPDPKWRKIPEIYFNTLKEEYAKKTAKKGDKDDKTEKGDPEEKAESPFEGIDVDALQKAFFSFCESI